MFVSLGQRIIDDFLGYMRNCGGVYSSWYVGISKDARQRLFVEHSVNEQSGVWIYRTADSSEEARTIESYFLKLGVDGGTGGGDDAARMVYAYKKTMNTNP